MRIKASYEHGSVLIYGREYYFQDYLCDVPDSVGNILLSRGDYSVALDIDLPITDAKKILFVRGAGLGDVMLCVPIVRHIKKNMNPKASIDWLCGTGEFASLLNGVEWVNKVYTDKNLPNDISKRYNCMVGIDYAEFKTNESFTHHRIDVFARRIKGMESVKITDKCLEYHITEKEKIWSRNMNLSKPYIVVTTDATCDNRILTHKQNEELCKAIIDKGYNVVMIDKNKKVNLHPEVYNLTGKLTLRQVGAILYYADAVICPDTGILHMAAALDKPTLAYFGAIDSNLRITSKFTKTITHPVECYPCNVYVCHLGKPKCVQDLKIDYIVQKMVATVAGAGVKKV